MSQLVSIIVPVYNLEERIEYCILSLTNQTYKNLEIICVDDGSTDGSASIVSKLIEEDARVKYFYQENGGVSSARNNGLENITGDYVMFVDGDDYLHPRTVEIFVDGILQTNCDIICSKMLKIDTYLSSFPEINEVKFFKINIEDTYSDSDDRSFATVTAKLFRREILKSARFPLNIKYGEDTNFSFKVLSNNPRISKIDEKLYFYYVRDLSAETSPFGLGKISVLDSYDDICEFFLNKQSSNLKSFAFQYLFQTICYIRTLAIGTEFEGLVKSKTRSLGRKWMPYFWKLKNLSFKNKIVVSIFYYFHFLYELIRLLIDPTMKDYYKNRKKNRKD